jgi:predicted RNA-binding protein with PUA-like domain
MHRAANRRAAAAFAAARLPSAPRWPMIKTEPDVYSFAQLQQERQTVWDGVTNPQAVKHLREMHKGDKLVIYHTGDERRVAGTAHVLSVDASTPKVPLITIVADKPVANPVSLADIKQSALFHTSPLVRQGRLSVVPLTELQYRALVSGEL